MPVTAKLSQRFYDVLGDQVATELVEWPNTVVKPLRTELSERSDLQFAWFDAKLEQRLSGVRAELRQEMAELRHEMAEFKAEVRQDVAMLRVELRDGLARTRASLIAWMFGFGVTATLALAGLIRSLLARP